MVSDSFRPEALGHLPTIEDQSDKGRLYLLDPKLRNEHPDLASHIRPKLLVPYVTLRDVFGEWAIGVGNDIYSDTARGIAKDAISHWTQLYNAGREVGYKKHQLRKNTHQPVWPDPFDIDEVLRACFPDGRFIDSLDHPLIQRILFGVIDGQVEEDDSE
jgi:hypothetical protein